MIPKTKFRKWLTVAMKSEGYGSGNAYFVSIKGTGSN